MEKVIDFGSHRVPLFWDGDLRPGVDVFAISDNMQSALIAVELLLDEQGLYHLWYGPEVIMEDGVFKATLVRCEKHWQGWQKFQRLDLVSRHRP